ncbi:hypothetical protein Tco_0296725 [Tanacetum coccineum]
MSTQQDIYGAGSKNRPPMLNKDNYVLWSSLLLCYAKSKPNGKLIYNSIMNSPHVRRMIPKPGDPDHEVPVVETFHEQTHDELTKKEVKQMEADDQAIQIILMGLPEDIYAANLNPNGNGNDVAARAEGIQLQAEEFAFMAAAGYLDEIEEVNANCILMANLTTWGTVEQNPATVEETRALYDSLYNNLAIKVEKVNTVNRKMKETNAELTTELARYKNQEKCFEINQEKYDKLERCYQKSVYQEQCLTKKINALHLSSAKTITTLNEEIANLNNQLSKEKSTVSSLQEEKKKLKSDFKIREDELLDKQIQLENKIKELDKE